MFIDISSNNGEVDFHQISEVDEVFIRSSLGYGDKDKNLINNATRADAAGFPVSYYHFCYPHDRAASVVDDATKQANYFVDTINALPKFRHLAIDLENFSPNNDTHLSQMQYAQWLQTFLDVVENRTGAQCVIYTYADYLNKHLPNNHNFGKYPLWIANYNANISEPPLVKGWDKAWAWQYSENGKINGILGHVDLSKTVDG